MSGTVVRFDHTIVPARDKWASARFVAGLVGLGEPEEVGHFVQVRLSDGAALDFADHPGGGMPSLHVALLVDDETFDAAYDRIRADGIEHWADPRARRPGEINTHHGGRGVYFQDPAGHFFELLTARYDGTRWFDA